jgi:hypothetical protein
MREKSGGIDPSEHTLPFDIKSSSVLSTSGKESDVHLLEVKNGKDSTVPIVLKENRLAEFPTDQQMKKFKGFYDFIKNDSEFGKFVIDSSFIKAKRSPSEPVRSYVVQKPLSGRRVEALSDKELYADPEILPELLEFINASISIIKRAGEHDRKIPDLYSDTRYFLGNFLHDPRYSGNIFISDRDPKNKQRVHFIDVGQVSGPAKDRPLKKCLLK